MADVFPPANQSDRGRDRAGAIEFVKFVKYGTVSCQVCQERHRLHGTVSVSCGTVSCEDNKGVTRTASRKPEFCP